MAVFRARTFAEFMEPALLIHGNRGSYVFYENHGIHSLALTAVFLNGTPPICHLELLCAQISLAARFGGVTMYNDTAVKNMYRAPLGTLVVIDGEFNSRLVGQSVTADTTTDTFVWMLKAYREAMGGKQPTVFIQDADAAMTGALGQVFPDAVARRCQWHLNQNLQKNLANVLGAAMKVTDGSRHNLGDFFCWAG